MKLTKDINPAIFREYDIRGVYPSQINEEVAYTIGRIGRASCRERV